MVMLWCGVLKTMAKLFRIRWFYILLLTSVYLPSAATANAGSDFLDKKEEEVKKLATAAQENHRKCELVSSCECSRATCVPVMEDQAMTCAVVNKNTLCTPPNGSTCKDMMLNYNRSYVTLPKGALPEEADFEKLELRPEVERDFCLQRGLDATFKDITKNQTQYTRMYYGSTSGAWRAFPGRELDKDFCTTYECRQRPWYLDGISVKKHVEILIDTGFSMGNSVNGEYGSRKLGTTYLQVAINISLSIIQTLSPEDYVDVISFDSTGAYSVLTSSVVMKAYNQSLVTGDVVNLELEPLKGKVGNLSSESAFRGDSNLTAALAQGINTFQNTTPKYLKLMVTITDGNLLEMNGTTFPLANALAAENAKLFMYKLPYNDDKDPYLGNSTLPALLCDGVKGSVETLHPPSTVNPLWAIRSYFSFLAKVHNVDSRAVWSNIYESRTQGLDTTTVAYPAFDSDGELIGVAGIDVYLTELDPNTETQVRDDLSNRRRGTLSPDAIILNCSYATVPTNHVCPDISVPAPGGIICPATDRRLLNERVCCRGCATDGPASSPAPAPSSNATSRTSDSGSRHNMVIGLGAGAGAVFLAAAVVIGVLGVRKRKRSKRGVGRGSWSWDGDGGSPNKAEPMFNPPPAEESTGKTAATN